MSQTSGKIINREIIRVNETQGKMIQSGWGKDVIKNSVVEKITYASDGLKIKGYLAYPSDTSKNYPCIIWNRGGIANKGAIDAFTARGLFGQIAGWGYVVFVSQYRGADGGEGYDEFGGEDINDVLNLIPLSSQLDFTDTGKWGIEGWSRGGMMTYLTLTKIKERMGNFSFKCAIVSGGIANLRCNSDESPFMRRLYEYTMGTYTDEEFYQKCNSRSIVNFAEKLPAETPLLILHGTDDDRVLPHDSLDLSHQLLKYKLPFRLIMLEGGDHFMRKHRKEVDRMRREWYDKYLK